MEDRIAELLAYTERNAHLELSVKISDGDSYASLGIDIEQLQKVHYLAGIAELLYSYICYLGGNVDDLPYTVGSLFEFERALSTVREDQSSWDIDGAIYERVFLQQFRLRAGGVWAIGSSRTLRIELVEVYKENPTVGKIIATGVAGAMLILSSCVGATWIMQQRDADRSRTEQIELAQQSTEMIARQARLEGRMSKQNVEAMNQIQETLRVGLAASGSRVDSTKIQFDTKTGKVIFVAGASSKVDGPEK